MSFRVKTVYFSGYLGLKLRCIKSHDGSDTGFSGTQGRPRFINPDSNRSHQSNTGNNDASVQSNPPSGKALPTHSFLW
jgi:hypothetical protein